MKMQEEKFRPKGENLLEMIQNEIAMLKKKRPIRNQTLNESQFSELLGLQSEDEPELLTKYRDFHQTLDQC